jgi:hypothetical protein
MLFKLNFDYVKLYLAKVGYIKLNLAKVGYLGLTWLY